MNILSLFHHTNANNDVLAIHGTGATDKPEDYGKPDAASHLEIAGATTPANWVEKDMLTGFATYPKRSQGTKFDCTCYAGAKLTSIEYLQQTGVWRELSPDMVYPYLCLPGGGADSQAVLKFIGERGIGVDALYPSDTLDEAQAESQANVPQDNKIIGMIYRLGQVVQCATDFETIASILQSYQAAGIKKGIAITIIGSNNSTWYSMMPQPPADAETGNPANWYHKVVVTDFGLINGQKYLSIDNSWGTAPGNKGQQFLGENYAFAIYGGLYTLTAPDMQTITAPNKPHHQWSAVLQIGSTGPDVLALQQALQSLGMFPVSSVVAPTGTFAGITQGAVKTFQAAFGLPQTGIVDEPTMEKLNSIFT